MAAKDALLARAEQWEPNIERFVVWGFDWLASRRGEFWKLSPKESRELSLSIACVAVKHVPEDYRERYGEEFVLGISLLFVFGPRLEKERRLAKSSPRPDGDAGDGQDDAPAPYPQPSA